jgi:hypothetical protein
MFRQLLARLVPKRRPFRIWVVQATAADTHKPPCDTVLGEVYHIHAAIHGPNQLLPVDALPQQPERPRTSKASGGSELT